MRETSPSANVYAWITRLSATWLAVEVADELMDVDRDRAVGTLGDRDRVDPGVDRGPLARPVVADRVLAVQPPSLPCVGPVDVVAARRQDALDVAGVECVVQSSQLLLSRGDG